MHRLCGAQRVPSRAPWGHSLRATRTFVPPAQSREGNRFQVRRLQETKAWVPPMALTFLVLVASACVLLTAQGAQAVRMRC